MTSLLVVIVLILLAVAVWQISKIHSLTQIGAGARLNDSQVANHKDNNINGYLMFGFLVFIYVLSIYSLYKWGPLVLISNSASVHGEEIDFVEIAGIAYRGSFYAILQPVELLEGMDVEVVQ